MEPNPPKLLSTMIRLQKTASHTRIVLMIITVLLSDVFSPRILVLNRTPWTRRP